MKTITKNIYHYNSSEEKIIPFVKNEVLNDLIYKFNSLSTSNRKILLRVLNTLYKSDEIKMMEGVAK